jgi:hypothetical protein
MLMVAVWALLSSMLDPLVGHPLNLFRILSQPLLTGIMWVPLYIRFNAVARFSGRHVRYGRWRCVIALLGFAMILLTPITAPKQVNFTNFLPVGWILAVVGSGLTTIVELLVWRHKGTEQM